MPDASSNEPEAVTPASSTKIFRGEIIDSACASMGSHDMEMKLHDARDTRDCTLNCVVSGARFVLYDAATKTSYQLDDQVRPKDFAGQKVRVIGTYDRPTRTIRIQSIEATSY